MPSFKELLKSRRLAKSLSTDKIARQLGCSGVYIIRVERGERNPPKLESILKLMQLLDDYDGELLKKAIEERGHIKIPVTRNEEINRLVFTIAKYLYDINTNLASTIVEAIETVHGGQ